MKKTLLFAILIQGINLLFGQGSSFSGAQNINFSGGNYENIYNLNPSIVYGQEHWWKFYGKEGQSVGFWAKSDNTDTSSYLLMDVKDSSGGTIQSEFYYRYDNSINPLDSNARCEVQALPSDGWYYVKVLSNSYSGSYDFIGANPALKLPFLQSSGSWECVQGHYVPGGNTSTHGADWEHAWDFSRSGVQYIVAPASGKIIYAHSNNDERKWYGSYYGVNNNSFSSWNDYPISANALPTTPQQYANNGVGNSITLYHYEYLRSVLPHMKKYEVYVRNGDFVLQGQVIGQVWRTGTATGNHIHYHLADSIPGHGTEWYPHSVPSAFIDSDGGGVIGHVPVAGNNYASQNPGAAIHLQSVGAESSWEVGETEGMYFQVKNEMEKDIVVDEFHVSLHDPATNTFVHALTPLYSATSFLIPAKGVSPQIVFYKDVVNSDIGNYDIVIKAEVDGRIIHLGASNDAQYKNYIPLSIASSAGGGTGGGCAGLVFEDDFTAGPQSWWDFTLGGSWSVSSNKLNQSNVTETGAYATTPIVNMSSYDYWELNVDAKITGVQSGYDGRIYVSFPGGYVRLDEGDDEIRIKTDHNLDVSYSINPNTTYSVDIEGWEDRVEVWVNGDRIGMNQRNVDDNWTYEIFKLRTNRTTATFDNFYLHMCNDNATTAQTQLAPFFTSSSNYWQTYQHPNDNAEVFSINTHGQDLGFLNIGYYKNSSIRTLDNYVVSSRNYTLNPTDPVNSAVSVRLYLTNSEFQDLKNHSSNIIEPEDVVVIQYSGINEDNDIANNTSSLYTTIIPEVLHFGSDYIFQFDLTSFSEFYFAGDKPVGTLPVELLSFTGVLEDDDALLSWSTASEINNDYFIIQRSLDGLTWEDVGNVEGNGNTNEIHNYSFVDKNISVHNSKVLYYRFIQMDFDGEFDISNIVTISLQGFDKNTIQVYPNPIDEKFYIQFSEEESFHVSLFNINGMKVVDKEYIGAKTEINMKTFPRGIYVIKVFTENNSYTEKIQKL